MKRILIVEPDRSSLSCLTNTLHEYCGFQGDIRTFTDERRMLHEICLCFYDVCFLASDLQGITVQEMMKHIMEVSPESVIVILRSEISYEVQVGKAMDSGIYSLSKPLQCYAIRDLMNRVFEGSLDRTGREAGGCERGQGKRKFARRELNNAVSFYLKDDILMEFEGVGLNVCYAGLGMETYYPLEKGQVLFFTRGIAHKVGIVVWSDEMCNRHFRAGIKFIN